MIYKYALLWWGMAAPLAEEDMNKQKEIEAEYAKIKTIFINVMRGNAQRGIEVGFKQTYIDKLREMGKIQELKDILIGDYTNQINAALDHTKLQMSAEFNILETLKRIDVML
jgi:hypothetical protein